MCSCSHCRNLLALGLVVGVVVLHEPPHAHVPTPGEQEVTLGAVAIVRSSSSGTGSVFVTPGRLTLTGFAPIVTVQPRAEDRKR